MTAPAPASAAPRTVVTSYRLYLLAAVLGLLGIVVSLVMLPQTIDAARRVTAQQLQGQDTAGIDVDAIATGAAIGSVAVGSLVALVLAVLTIVFARRLLAGRNWARIVLLVFAVLHLPGLLGLAGAGSSVVSALVAVLLVLASAAAAVLSLLPASNPWFRRTLLPPAAV